MGAGTPSSPDKANKFPNYSGTRASPLLKKHSYMNKFLNKHEPIYETTGNLPHWTQYGKITFVTFRLADSLPQYIIDNIKTEYESIKQQLLKEGNLKELEFLKFEKT